MSAPRLRFFDEILGLHPLPLRARQAWFAIRGDADVPPSRADLSSLAQLRPRLAIPLWRGRAPVPRRVVITNLFNHTPTPIEDGWSVRRTQMRDFRGRTLTYDSHNGTDFAIPVGTPVLAAAPGEVVHVVSELHRGGLKIFVDHGEGLMTTYAHLARALVRVGDRVQRTDPIALSGYSGLDGVVTFPFGVPHVHFNVWLDAVPVDPFAHPVAHGDDACSMWRGGDLPRAPAANEPAEGFTPSEYDDAALEAAIAACNDPSTRAQLRAVASRSHRAARTVIASCYYPTRFARRVSPYRGVHARRPVLTLPFPAERFDGVVFVDDGVLA